MVGSYKYRLRQEARGEQCHTLRRAARYETARTIKYTLYSKLHEIDNIIVLLFANTHPKILLKINSKIHFICDVTQGSLTFISTSTTLGRRELVSTGCCKSRWRLLVIVSTASELYDIIIIDIHQSSIVHLNDCKVCYIRYHIIVINQSTMFP